MKRKSYLKLLTKNCAVTASSEVQQIHGKLSDPAGIAFSDKCPHQMDILMLFYHSSVSTPLRFALYFDPHFFPMVLVSTVECITGSGPCRLSPQNNECVHACSLTIFCSPFTQRDFETQARGNKKCNQSLRNCNQDNGKAQC